MLLGIFTIITLGFNLLGTYVSEVETYRVQNGENLRSIARYLSKMLESEGDEFVFYQQYFLKHGNEIEIPYDFTDYKEAKQNFYALLLSQPIEDFSLKSLETLSEEAKRAFFIYKHEFYMLKFEEACKTFDIPYAYYILPDESSYHIIYVLDGERLLKNEGNNLLYLGDSYYNDPKEYPVEWDTWYSGIEQEAYQIWDNEWGHTYSCYIPLFINGHKMGLVGAELEIDAVHKEFLRNAILQTLSFGILLIIFIALLLYLSYRQHIARINMLDSYVREYSAYKDSRIADKIRSQIKSNDELSSLSFHVASMIGDLEDYIKSLSSTSRDLLKTSKQVDELNELANRDTLTGVRNRNSFDNIMQLLDERLNDAEKSKMLSFAIAVIDMNFLKRLNDNFGRDRGDIAIKKLCAMICSVFKRSPVFRIKGGEFIVLLEGDDYVDMDSLAFKFVSLVAKCSIDTSLNEWEKISAAIGISSYNSNKDVDAEDVVLRAYDTMYRYKEEMKTSPERHS